MISYISGTIQALHTQSVTILTNSGIGYEVFVSKHLLNKVTTNLPIELIIYTNVKEDSWTLFGFEDIQAKDFFTIVLGISGVGPKTAFTIVSNVTLAQVFQAIQKGDVSILEDIPGLGKKTAAKVMLELSQKLNKDIELKKLMEQNTHINSALLEALQSLGIKTSDSKDILKDIDDSLPLEKQIPLALQLLNKKK